MSLISILIFSLDTNIRKDHSLARPFGDDPFALDGFGDCTIEFFQKTEINSFILVAAPASVIGIGGDHTDLMNDKDHYDHVMSPFHRS